MSDRDKPPTREPTFAELIGKVRRLDNDTVDLKKDRAAPRRRAAVAEREIVETHPFREYDDRDISEEYHRNGVQQNILRKLRRGQYPIEDEADLHGLTVTQARARLHLFLDHARGPRIVCVRVIHGKGLSSPGAKPVIKPRVQHWLRHDDRVLAFVPARREDGGSGAMYVLLRSRSH